MGAMPSRSLSYRLKNVNVKPIEENCADFNQSDKLQGFIYNANLRYFIHAGLGMHLWDLKVL